VHDFEHSDYEVKEELWKHIFYKKRWPAVMHKDFCIECAKQVTPIVHELRDVCELLAFVNKLKATINEHKRNQNNG
jgi:hypothetical protein